MFAQLRAKEEEYSNTLLLFPNLRDSDQSDKHFSHLIFLTSHRMDSLAHVSVADDGLGLGDGARCSVLNLSKTRTQTGHHQPSSSSLTHCAHLLPSPSLRSPSRIHFRLHSQTFICLCVQVIVTVCTGYDPRSNC